MKKIIYIFFLLIGITACEIDFLDGTKPVDKISDADVWNSSSLALKVVNGGYSSLPNGHSYMMMMSTIDEGVFQFNDLGTPYTHAEVTPQNLGTFYDNWAIGQSGWSWDALYRNIRSMSIAINNIPNVPFASQDDKDKVLADAFFIRGFSYFLLMSNYGGVVLYEDIVQLGDEYSKPRSTFEETVNFIVSDLDQAISLYKENDIGKIKTRGDRGSAMALKAKVLLYAASDLHNPSKNSSLLSGYSNPELVGYVSGDPRERWTNAKNAAKAVIDLNKYSLYNAKSDKVRNFEEIFLKRSDEDIFLKYGDQLINAWQINLTPFSLLSVGYGGWATNTILGDLVDAFEMLDGSKFDWNNPTMASNPYKNRDPRLSASILFEGATWFERSSTDSKIRTGEWPDGTTGPDRQQTNYYLRKWSNIEGPLPTYDNFTLCPPWVRLRYAEVLLNYAEACIELGEDNEARLYINMIRGRAGMPPITESGDALKERYRNERRVELAFEENRFFDVRRWMIGPVSANSGNGVEVKYPIQGSYENPTFRKVMVDEGRKWHNKEYFLPIHVDEMNKNKSLIQNPGY